MREGNLVFWAFAAADIAVACALAAWTARGRRRFLRLIATLALVAGAFALKTGVLFLLGLNIFGLAHVVWLEAVVVLPAMGLALVLIGRGALRWAGAPFCLLALVGVYGTFIEPKQLVVEEATVEVPAKRLGSSPVRIGVMSDLQFERVGPHERKAVDRLMELRPDVILLPGDYHQGSSEVFREELPEIRNLLGRLDAPGGVFAVHGDVESPAKAAETLRGTGIRLLVNEVASTRVRDRRLTIAGTELQWWRPRVKAFERPFEEAPGEDLRIFLSHRPDAAYVPHRRIDPRDHVDLTVAGHTHGGQIQLPWLGPIATSSNVPDEAAAGGLHVLEGDRPVYVSRGVGAERGQAPLVRIGAPPEISIVTFRDRR